MLPWKYKKSPLVQGGLEVLCEVMVTMSESVVKHLLLAWYEKLLNELYIEAKNKEIVGTFLSVANEKGKQAERKLLQQKKQQEKKDVRSRDIQDMLQNTRSKKDRTKKINVLGQCEWHNIFTFSKNYNLGRNQFLEVPNFCHKPFTKLLNSNTNLI